VDNLTNIMSTILNFAELEKSLPKRFGPIDEPLNWFGVNTNEIKESLSGLHVINRKGLISNLRGASEKLATAYMVARLVAGRAVEDVPLGFRASLKKFGVVALIGSTEAIKPILGVGYADGIVRVEQGVEIAHFVTPQGICATVRHAINPGTSHSFILNSDGGSELSLQEMLPEAQNVVASLVKTVDKA